MAIIEAGAGIVTHIDVFTVEPDKQRELIASLTQTVEEARNVEGWISAAIQRSFDGTHVVNYVQFEIQAAAQAVTRHLLSQGLIQRNTALASVAPGQYEVVYSCVRVMLAPSTSEFATLKCEEWHLRLGQIADRAAVIDFAAQTCAAQPCTISQAAFKWNELNGRSDVAIDRASGEGTSTYQGEVTTTLKNCKLVAGRS